MTQALITRNPELATFTPLQTFVDAYNKIDDDVADDDEDVNGGNDDYGDGGSALRASDFACVLEMRFHKHTKVKRDDLYFNEQTIDNVMQRLNTTADDDVDDASIDTDSLDTSEESNDTDDAARMKAGWLPCRDGAMFW
jgi:hypothetical protein